MGNGFTITGVPVDADTRPCEVQEVPAGGYIK